MWVSNFEAYLGFAYDTRVVTKSEMPKTWNDVLTSPLLRNGSLVMFNNTTDWLDQLANYYGIKWESNFQNKLFSEVKPSLNAQGNVGVGCRSW